MSLRRYLPWIISLPLILSACSYSSTRVSLGSGGTYYKDCPYEAYSHQSGTKVFSHVVSHTDDEGIFKIVSGTPPSDSDTLEGDFSGFGVREIRDVSAQTGPIQVDVIFHAGDYQPILTRMGTLGCFGS